MASAIAYRGSGCRWQYVNRAGTLGMVWLGGPGDPAGTTDAGNQVRKEPASGACGHGGERATLQTLQEIKPLTSEEGGTICAHDGTLVNAVELRKVCMSKGHTFATGLGAEVVVHLFEDFGIAAATSLRGALSFALWDNALDRLFLVRDRFGERPVYFAAVADSLLFASEAKAILASGLVPRKPDSEALSQFLMTGHIPLMATPFGGVQKLPAGHLLIFDENSRDLKKYWQLGKPESLPRTHMDAHDKFFSEVFEAVKLYVTRMSRPAVAVDRDIGSAVLAGLCSLVLKDKTRTYAIGIGAEAFDHLEHARTVGRHFNTEHTEFLGESGPAVLGHLLAKMQWHMDAPCADPQQLDLLQFGRMAGSCGPVVMASCGLAELMVISPENMAALPPPPQPDRGVTRRILRGVKTAVRGVFGGGAPPATDLLKDASALARDDPAIWALDGALAGFYAAGAAGGVEFSLPMLDHLLAEFIFALPREWKVRGGLNLMTESFKSLIPQQLSYHFPVADRFGAPKPATTKPDDDRWLKPEGLWEDVKKRILDRRSSLGDYIGKSEVEKLLTEHEKKTANHATRIWRVLALAEWLAQQADSAPPPDHVPWPPCAKGR
jgi:asparagine synthase (glutamine-hydrolysing)